MSRLVQRGNHHLLPPKKKKTDKITSLNHRPLHYSPNIPQITTRKTTTHKTKWNRKEAVTRHRTAVSQQHNLFKLFICVVRSTVRAGLNGNFSCADRSFCLCEGASTKFNDVLIFGWISNRKVKAFGFDII